MKKKTTRKKKKAQKKAPFLVLKRNEVAEFFGASLRTVDKWRERGMPGKAGQWDVSAIAKWLRARWIEDKNRRKKEAENDPDRQYKQYRAKILRLKFLQKKNELIPLNEHEEYTQKLCTAFRNKLLSLGSSLAAQLQGLESQAMNAMILDRFYELLEDLSSADDGKEEGATN